MCFPFSAQGYIEDRISLDKPLIAHPSATYFMRGATHTGALASRRGRCSLSISR